MTDRDDPLALARGLLGSSRSWLVGGAVRDELLGKPASIDLDLVLDAPVASTARALARAARGAVAFPLSEEFGAWRVVARDHAWQLDLSPLRGGTIDADLALRDFTVNAIARPLAGGALVDPFDGAADLAAGRLRLVAPRAIAADPLRSLRLVRLACELDLEPDGAARAAARDAAPALARVAAERVYGELRRILASERPGDGMRLALELGCCAAVLPEVEALRGVEQSRYHHLDVLDHTLAVLDRLVDVERDPAATFGPEHADALGELLARPLADEMTRGEVLRFGALLHDVAKPQTRAVEADGRIRFLGHDVLGAGIARATLARLRAADRVGAQVEGLTRSHLRLGFLVAETPLTRRALYDYLDACDPLPADVTVLSVADRLATRGDRADEAIARHLALAREVIGEALRWQLDGRPRAPVRGDELARALDLEPGPIIGELLTAIEREAFAGRIAGADEALAFAASRIA
jgi:putative nucleotidyltransferase with HDIG domain